LKTAGFSGLYSAPNFAINFDAITSRKMQSGEEIASSRKKTSLPLALKGHQQLYTIAEL
jgi:hypothetical protein